MQFHNKCGLTGVVLICAGLVFALAILPQIISWKLHRELQLKDSESRKNWEKLPFALDFRVWLFNITNAEDVINGSKPIVQQVGPYFYEEYVEKVNIVDNETDDSVEYARKTTFFFNASRSDGLTGDEELVLTHTFMLGMLLTVERSAPMMLPMAGQAVDSIFKEPESIFIRVKARDILFDGLPINCAEVEDAIGREACQIIQGSGADLVPDGENRYLFSYFGGKNNSVPQKRLKALRGTGDYRNIGRVVEHGGLTNISIWGDKYCDEFRGTDGDILHPMLYEDENITTYAVDMCRNLELNFEKKSEAAGVSTNRYVMWLNSTSSEKCYCDTPGNCLKSGVIDLFKCIKVPLVNSHPHFLGADESYLQMVDGLEPENKKHETFIDLEPTTGKPIFIRKRLQYNVFLHPVNDLQLMENLPTALLPLFWVEEGATLPDPILQKIKYSLLLFQIANYARWIIVATGLILCCFAVFQNCTNANKTVSTETIMSTITPKFNEAYGGSVRIKRPSS